MTQHCDITDAAGVTRDVVALGYFDLLALDLEESDDDSYGLARITLRVNDGGFVPSLTDAVKLYDATGSSVTDRWFGGNICDIDYKTEGDELWLVLTVRDNSEQLDTLVLESLQGTTAGFSLVGAIAQMTQKVQNTGGAALIGIDAITDVADLTPGSTYPHYSWAAGTSLRTIVTVLCNAAQVIIPALVPRFRIGLAQTGTTFGVPWLSLWDGAATPTPVYRFSTRAADIAAGTHKIVLAPFGRKVDGTNLVTRIRANGDSGLTSVQEDAAAKLLFPNPYSATNAWSREPIEDSGLTVQADVDNLATCYVAENARGRESIQFATWERVRPGQYVSLINHKTGPLTETTYPVSSVRIVWETPLKPKFYLTLKNARREL